MRNKESQPQSEVTYHGNTWVFSDRNLWLTPAHTKIITSSNLPEGMQNLLTTVAATTICDTSWRFEALLLARREDSVSFVFTNPLFSDLIPNGSFQPKFETFLSSEILDSSHQGVETLRISPELFQNLVANTNFLLGSISADFNVVKSSSPKRLWKSATTELYSQPGVGVLQFNFLSLHTILREREISLGNAVKALSAAQGKFITANEERDKIANQLVEDPRLLFNPSWR